MFQLKYKDPPKKVLSCLVLLTGYYLKANIKNEHLFQVPSQRKLT